jgi:PAS domain S-box-containing protein
MNLEESQEPLEESRGNLQASHTQKSADAAGKVQPSVASGEVEGRYSPARLFIFTIGGIALAEVIAMIIIYNFRAWPYTLQVFVDASIMTVIIFPLLYFLSFKPLLLHIQKRTRLDNIIQARLRLMQYAGAHTEAELLQATLDNIEALTGATIGFFHFLDADQVTLLLQAWSKNTLQNMCTASGKDRHYDLEQAGVWAECVRQRQPVIHNDYASLPNRKGMPAGHALVVREMAVPIMRQGKIVAIVGVGNKPQNFDSGDVEVISTLADFVWDTVENKRAEAALRASEQKFRTLADWTYDWEKWVDPAGAIVYTSPSCERITGYSPAEFIADPELEANIIHPDDRPAYTEHQQSLHDESTGLVKMEYRITNRAGEERWLDHVCRPLFGPDGEYLGRRISNRDITYRREKETQLEQTNLELQKISAIEHKQRQFSEALADAAGAVNGTLESESVLSAILNKIREVIPYSYANVALLEGDYFYVASQASFIDPDEPLPGLKKRFSLEKFHELETMRHTRQPALIAEIEKGSDRLRDEGLGWARSFLAAPLLINQQVMGFVNLFDEKPAFFTPEMRDRLAAFAAHAAIAIQNAWLFEQTRAGNERLQALSRRLVEIQENERHYISRELHDESGQALTSLMLDLRLLENNADKPEAVLQKVAEMEASLDDIMKNLHRVAMALRPASLDHLGLVAALRQHVESVGAKYGLKIYFKETGIKERLPDNVETVLYRITQEALTNVVKHARASQVDVILTVRNEKLVLIIEDDGCGFDPEAVPNDGHLGLFGLRERAQMIDGALTIESAQGKGTTILVEVNYANPFINS